MRELYFAWTRLVVNKLSYVKSSELDEFEFIIANVNTGL